MTVGEHHTRHPNMAEKQTLQSNNNMYRLPSGSRPTGKTWPSCQFKHAQLTNESYSEAFVIQFIDIVDFLNTCEIAISVFKEPIA